MLVSIAILVILILISGFLSSLEIAVSSSNRNKVKMLVEADDKRAMRLLSTMDTPHNFFATTQLYITFIAFFSGAYAANSFTDPLIDWALRIGIPLSENVVEPVIFIVITGLLTYVSLIFGELVPKRIAMQYAIPFALRALPILNVLSIIAFPFVKILSASSKLVLKIIGISDDDMEEDITKEEIRLMVESSSDHGHIAESEHGMIENIFEFDKLTAGDICRHRIDVIALPIDSDFEAVVGVLTAENYTRVPVYEESLDNVRGILNSKDLLNYMVTNPNLSNFDLKNLLRDAHFVPLSKKAGELFQEMRDEHTYMAVVIDEYGGTMGIVTMEDLVEKIVGSIHDEYDEDELPDIADHGEDAYRIQGLTDLETVGNHLEIELPIDEYDTLSGFLVGQIGHIPSEDEFPEVTYQGVVFKVESVQEKRIGEVTVTRLEEAETEESQ
ncbi:MAG: hemolysin family protein [Oscillospiraceae bacterium]|nr:hemolysin family protein [Oscillospiraceae bacterium]